MESGKPMRHERATGGNGHGSRQGGQADRSAHETTGTKPAAFAASLASSLADLVRQEDKVAIIAGGTSEADSAVQPTDSSSDSSRGPQRLGQLHPDVGVRKSSSISLPLVTATTNTTTSSGDDRDSSGGSGSGYGSTHPLTHSVTNPRDVAVGASGLEPKAGSATKPRGLSDECGLPVPFDDRLHKTAARHATVVAKLPPPPQTNPSLSSSFISSSSEKGGNGSGSDTNGWTIDMKPSFVSPKKPLPDAKAAQKRIKEDATEPSVAGKKRADSIEGMGIGPMTKRRRPSHKAGSDTSRGGSSASSATEAGYAASASSDENAVQQSSCSSPSMSSSEEQNLSSTKKSRIFTNEAKRKPKRFSSTSSFSSSEIADFSSGNGMSETTAICSNFNASSCMSAPGSPALSSSSTGDESSDEPDNRPPPIPIGSGRIQPRARNSNRNRLHPKRSRPCEEGALINLMDSKMAIATRRKTHLTRHHSLLQDNYQSAMREMRERSLLTKSDAGDSGSAKASPDAPVLLNGKPPLLSLNYDIMANCMSFLEPPEVQALLTMPLSKDWYQTFTMPQDLWRVLCLTDPFKAKFDSEEQDSSDESGNSIPTHGLDVNHLLGRYRLLYTSFVRCVRYLTRIKEDAMNGRPPLVIDYGANEMNSSSLRTNQSLKSFLARARGVVIANKRKRVRAKKTSEAVAGCRDPGTEARPSARQKRKSSKKKEEKESKEKVKYGHSQLTLRLLGPSESGQAGNVNLPWSCAIYSIINWMVAFTNVEGIQTICMKVLPFLLEDEVQRTTAQRAGLTDIVLRAMVLFPDSVHLHTAAFHTIVLLARPLGGREGMLFHCSMVNSSGIFGKGSRSGKNGIGVMLDSTRRFQTDEVLQAMSCWSLVNIALAPSQKAVLVKLGGISVVANAMMQHPFNAEVQFRALFALINLVIPSVNTTEGNQSESRAIQEQPGEVNETSEKEMLDDSVGQIVNLVVVAMKNFCSSESILNRACLVLHNLSLTEDYHTMLLWTPNCYQMLEWCLANYRTDQVLQQSAAGTLHRLQTTLSNDDELRARFASSLQSQQQSSLELAHREALMLHENEQIGRSQQQLPL